MAVIRRIFWFGLALLALGQTAFAAEGVKVSGRLDNGFTYSLQPSFSQNTDKPQQDLALTFYVNVGAFQESQTQQGYADLIGRFHNDLLWRSDFTQARYEYIVEDITPQKMQASLQAIKDIATGAQLNQSNLAAALKLSLRQVAVNAKSASDHLIFQLPVVDGEVLEKAKIAPLKVFFDRWYQPQYMHLSIAGKFDAKRMQQLIAKVFGNLKSNDLPREPRALYQTPNGIEHIIAHYYRNNHLRVLLPIEPPKDSTQRNQNLYGFQLEHFVGIGLRMEAHPNQRADSQVVYYQNKSYIEIVSRYNLPISEAVKNIIDRLDEARGIGFLEHHIDGMQMWLRESGAGPEPEYDTGLLEISGDLYYERDKPNIGSPETEPNKYMTYVMVEDADYKLLDKRIKQILSAKISLITQQPEEISAAEKLKVQKLIDDYNDGKWSE